MMLLGTVAANGSSAIHGARYLVYTIALTEHDNDDDNDNENDNYLKVFPLHGQGLFSPDLGPTTSSLDHMMGIKSKHARPPSTTKVSRPQKVS